MTDVHKSQEVTIETGNDQIVFNLKDTRSNSEKLGNCEICHQYCSSVFVLTKKTRYQRHDGQNGYSEGPSSFGCESCLEQIIQQQDLALKTPSTTRAIPKDYQ